MRFSALTTACATCALAALAVGAHAQTLHLVQPVDNAIVRETVPFRVQPGDLPKNGGYVEVKIDGNFRTARALPSTAASPVYIWDTKEEGANAVSDGAHTVELDIYDSGSNLVGTATLHLQVANQISAPSQDLKLVYHWASQHHLVYHRVSDMTVPGTQGVVTTPAADATAAPMAPPDDVVQSSDLEFARTTESATEAQSVVRDLITGGTITDHGLRQAILNLYGVSPYRRTVNDRGEILSGDESADFADHIGFPIPELPVRRVGKGDSWQANVLIPLNWDGSSAAHATVDCQLQDFEWEDGYPCAKIVEAYKGAANFVAVRPVSASNHPAPKLDASAVTFNRVIFFSYNSGRLIKEVTNTQITLTEAQMNSLGATIPYSASAGGFGEAAAPTTGILDANETTELETP